MKRSLSLFLVSCVIASAADVQFKGYVWNGGKPLVLVAVDGRTSGWLAAGQTFGAVRIVQFDRSTEALVVLAAGQRRTLSLGDGHVRAGAATAPAVPTLPAAPSDGTVPAKSALIAIGGRGALVVESTAGSLDRLQEFVADAMRHDPNAQVSLRVAPDADAALTKDVLDLVNRAHVRRFTAQFGKRP